MSDVYEGLTSGQYEDWEPEYDAGDLEEETDIPDEDTGYGTYSYFAHAMITE